MGGSLFRACKNAIRNDQHESIQKVGDYDIAIEYYTQTDIDENVRKIKFNEASKCTFGDTDESKVVLVASDTITIPQGFNLTPASPKKSLVIMCNTLVNNGTISMTGKAPNVLPHDWFVVGKVDGYDEDVTIPAYAHNEQGKGVYCAAYKNTNGLTGNNGTNRQCGSGGTSMTFATVSRHVMVSGQGYSFGGGAGSGSYCMPYDYSTVSNEDILANYCVSETYPMRGGRALDCYKSSPLLYLLSGVGNPCYGTSADKYHAQNVGCGGRIIIFCKSIINNGTISSNGVTSFGSTERPATNSNAIFSAAGSSGGGAVDLFCEDLSGIVNRPIANGGAAAPSNWDGTIRYGGAGGNGSITLSDGIQAPLWVMPDCFKGKVKYFSQANVAYLLSELTERIKQSHINE